MYQMLIFVILVFIALLIYLMVRRHVLKENFTDQESIDKNKKRLVYTLIPNLDYDITKYLGLFIPSSNDDSNNNAIFTTSLSTNYWEGPIDKSGPDDGSVILSVIYNPNKELLGIGKNIINNKTVYNLYHKKCIDSSSDWTKIESNKNIRNILYDKDNRLIGCEYPSGHIFKKKTIELSSDWEGPLNNNVPMKKIMYDRDRVLLGIGLKDNYIYKKRGLDWINEDWDLNNINRTEVWDLLHDYDGKLIATTENGILKQNQTSYMSPFYKIDTIENGKKILALNDIIYFKCGVTLLSDFLLENKYNDKNIDDLNAVLEFKEKAKKMCKSRQFKLNEVDSKNSLIIQKQNLLISDIESLINKMNQS